MLEEPTLPARNGTDNIMPLRDCADYLDVSVTQLEEWSSPRKQQSNGFPEPVERLGRYKLYDVYQVQRWVHLWKKINKNMGRGKDLNGA